MPQDLAGIFSYVTRRPRIDFSEYLPYLINRVGSALVVDFGGYALAHHGLSIAMWRVLAVLSNNDGQRQIDLAAKTSIDVSTLSRVVGRLVKMALVTRTRSATNSREVVVRLTAKGAATLARLIPRAIAAERAAIAGVSAKDLTVVKRSLRRMYQNLAPDVSEGSAANHARGRAASAASSSRHQPGAGRIRR